MTRMQLWKILPAAALAALVACGGGGSSTPSSSAPPTVSAAVVSNGAITGFGSVHVNGEHFDTTSTTFEINGANGSQDDLRVGHRIHVRGHHDASGRAFADRIEFRSEVRGPVASVDATANTLVVLGQTIVVDADTSIDDDIPGSVLTGITVGSIVEVSGARRADGSVLATRIEASTGQPRVRGTIASLDAAVHIFRIAALVVDYSGATLADFGGAQPKDGDAVEVEGGTIDANGVLVARRVEKEGADDGVAGDRAEYEGPITRFVSATDFDIGGRKVTTTGATTYEGGAVTDLALNVKVEAEGALDANDVLVATKVEFRRRGDARLEGTVDSVNATAGTLVVLGVDVTVNAATRLEDKSDQRVKMFSLANLVVGDYVELRGAEQGDNDIVATRLERRRAESDVRVRGVVDSATSPNFSVLGITVQTSATTRFDDGSADAFFTDLVGRTVSVQGTIANGVLLAREVEFEDHED